MMAYVEIERLRFANGGMGVMVNPCTHIDKADPALRAERLLRRHLSSEQLATYLRFGWFRVHSEPEHGSFLVTNACNVQGTHTYNVVVEDYEYSTLSLRGCQLCVIISDKAIPLPDVLLAQKLMLQFNPQFFVSIANRRPPEEFNIMHPQLSLYRLLAQETQSPGYKSR